ncbi:MAG: MFS transporter [Solirubrobacteraceae bacterium]
MPDLQNATGTDRRWRVLTVVSVATFMASLDLFIVNIAFPDISRAFEGTSMAAMSWVLNAYAIVFAALLVPAGRMADRIGRKRAFVGGIAVFVVGSALCGIADSVGVLIGARVIQAAGGAVLLPTSLALLLPEFAPAERPKAISIWAAVGAVAAAAGPPVGGLLVEASWRLVFLVNVPVGLAAIYFSLRVLRESRDPDQTRPDLPGTVIFAASIGLLALGLVKAPAWGWGSPATLGALAASALGLGAFWMRCRTHPSPVVEPAMLRVRSFALAGIASLLFSTAFGAMLLAGVLFMTGVWHYSVLKAGLSLAPGPAMAATFATISGRLPLRIAPGALAATGMGVFACGVGFWLWQIGAAPHYASEMLPGQILTGAGVGLALPTLAGAATASLPPARFATGSAVFTMSRQLGFVLGVSILVAVLGSVDGGGGGDPVSPFDAAWTFMVVVLLAGATSALAIGPVSGRAPVVAAEPAT